jgi:hypothetical protein
MKTTITKAQLADVLTAIHHSGEPGDYKYHLTRDVTIPIPLALSPAVEVHHRWFSIAKDAAGWALTVKSGYAWDGATAASDFAPGASMGKALALMAGGDAGAAVEAVAPLLASASHDPLYQFLEYLSSVWGRPLADVRLWADLLFRAVMEAAGATSQAKRYFWAVRLLGGLFNWWGRKRSRIEWNPAKWFGVLLVSACLLAQGCATSAWHNYQVSEAERSERDQLDAGLIPLVKTNGDLVRENWFGYVVGLAIDAGAAYCVYRYVEREDRRAGDVYHTEINYPPETVTDDSGSEGGGL